MYIKKVNITNFRLLKNAELSFEEKTTVIVGRNNSGKTSLAELFRRLLSDNLPIFHLEDFSLGVHEQFWIAFTLAQKKVEEAEIRRILPVIEAQITVGYNKDDDNLGTLGDFIIDLNPDCIEVLIDVRYQVGDGKIKAMFENVEVDGNISEIEQKTEFFRVLKERIPGNFRANLLAVDPNDHSNQKQMDWSKLRALLQSGFINAQRGLDDVTNRENDVLGKILEVLFNTARSDSAAPDDKKTARLLESAVLTVQKEIDKDFNGQLTNLLPAFTLFGYPGLPDPQLRTETLLDVQRLLNNYTKIRYSGVNGVHLPEAYNGLGARNLIFILLKLLEFFKSFKATQPTPGVHLIFIEEPEVHLHPQMQEVFINKLSEIADVFAETYNDKQPWPVQFIITTHSSHIANKASFKTMRYFLAISEEVNRAYSTKIKDLGKGFSSELKDDEAFLHQYMTLTRCDLLFADKAILIEGTTERILLPKMISKTDEGLTLEHQLASQYISVIEVGGAYAHRFFKLLNFLELPTLIITDLDPVKKNEDNKYVICKVSEGTHTSNGCIKNWFNNPNATPAELTKKACTEKINNFYRLAYQVPEADGKPCGRSFEDAFILANSTLFEITVDSFEKTEEDALLKAKGVKKSEFALKYAIEQVEWTVPLYIKEGLLWLAENVKQPASVVKVESSSVAEGTNISHEQDAPHE